MTNKNKEWFEIKSVLCNAVYDITRRFEEDFEAEILLLGLKSIISTEINDIRRRRAHMERYGVISMRDYKE